MKQDPSIEQLIKAILVKVDSPENKSLIETYFRNRDALNPEYQQKAAEKIMEALSEYPELKQRSIAEDLGITEEELIKGYTQYKELQKQLDEAKKRLDKYKEPDYGPIDALDSKIETVMFNGRELCKDEYEALQEMALEYFNQAAEEYFESEFSRCKSCIGIGDYNKRIERIQVFEGNLKEIPIQITELRHLEVVLLRGNQITKIENLENLKQLKRLDLGRNMISKIENLEKQIQLQYLDIGYNQIIKIENLENQKQLQILEIKGNPIPKYDPGLKELIARNVEVSF